jgi:hypothetical protein
LNLPASCWNCTRYAFSNFSSISSRALIIHCLSNLRPAFIRDLIIRNWDKEENIEISFEGVYLATPSFIDESIGKLIHNYSLEQLQNKLLFAHINEDLKDKINKSIELRLQQKQK